MKKLILIFVIALLITGCKSAIINSKSGNFRIENYSDKEIAFIWIAPEGDFFPTSQSINIGKEEAFELKGLPIGIYDIAIDFKDEYNSFNSKKDKSLCLKIEKDITTLWKVDETGNVIRK